MELGCPGFLEAMLLFLFGLGYVIDFKTSQVVYCWCVNSPTGFGKEVSLVKAAGFGEWKVRVPLPSMLVLANRPSLNTKLSSQNCEGLW